ncbi:MAG: hypothetical protein EOO17_05155 [Chloroflexi bacterium]|nr:MAG: hypothetical protein EOO17_05155 [Chloroflexota bacterium]
MQSFKQEQSPRYSALRAASILASYHQAKVIIGSATPLIADYYIAEHSGRPIITIDTKARLDTTAPSVTLVDMTKRASFKKHRFLSDQLIAQLESTFASGKQALIFHNRRGSASTTLCENCGWSASCTRCFTPLTLHADHHHLRCHICGNTEKVPTSCPECHHADIIHKGIGTKLIESELMKLFPDKTIARFDGDNNDGDTVESRYNDLYSGAIDLIIGTQVVAKGLDLPHLRTVGVIQADAGGHIAVIDGIAQNYTHFYEATIAERQRALFPPFTYLLKLTCVYKTEAAAVRNAQQLARELRKNAGDDVQILGPTPAFYERQRDTYRWQLVIKSPKRGSLTQLLTHVPAQHWQYELDPLSLL